MNLSMEDHRDEDYLPTKMKLKVFSGQGHTLGRYISHNHTLFRYVSDNLGMYIKSQALPGVLAQLQML